jgi:L-aminopeptidase/D-esterase-like protein
MRALAPGSINDVAGVCMGHYTDSKAQTGCTVVLAGRGAVGGVSVRGLAPGTRETDLLRPGNLVSRVHAVLLTGGSAFGLAAADGVMRYLEEHRVGYDTGSAKVPIVPAAVLYDLEFGSAAVRPDAACGYAACRSAAECGRSHRRDNRVNSSHKVSDALPQQGNVGAGTGATVGKLFGLARAMKGGLGTASLRVGGLVVGAAVAVNAFGDICEPDSKRIVAGARTSEGNGFADTSAALQGLVVRTAMTLRNTIIGVVATNARLDVAQTNQVAAAAHDGMARVVRPSHTLFDGDTLFALSTGRVAASLVLVCDLAATVVMLAIINGVLAAEPVLGLPAASTFD